MIVVDDGSPDPRPIAAVAEQVGARYVRHRENQGPAAARNTGLRMASSQLVGFLDADCIPPAGFPGRLLDHLADPAVALVAPRSRTSERQRGPIAAYERARSALDMGPRPSLVRPYSTVWYVPSAAMLARRDALGAGFDEGLVLGEDVDLVWRLHDAGWQVRYEPEVVVAHEDRVRPVVWYCRRVAYNESVAPLLMRHPERVPVVFLSPRAARRLGSGADRVGGAAVRPRRRARGQSWPDTGRATCRTRWLERHGSASRSRSGRDAISGGRWLGHGLRSRWRGWPSPADADGVWPLASAVCVVAMALRRLARPSVRNSTRAFRGAPARRRVDPRLWDLDRLPARARLQGPPPADAAAGRRR